MVGEGVKVAVAVGVGVEVEVEEGVMVAVKDGVLLGEGGIVGVFVGGTAVVGEAQPTI